MIDQQPMTDAVLASIIKREIDKSDVRTKESFAGDRDLADAYYHSRELARGEDCKGFSNIVTADVANAIDNCLADAMPAFAADDLQCRFEPMSAEDEDQADLESRIVSQVLMDGSKGFSLLRDAFFECLLFRNCALKVSYESKDVVSIDEYENVQVEQLVQMMPFLASPDVTEELVDQELEKMGMAFVEPPSENEDGTMSFKIRTKKPLGRPVVECLPLGDVKIHPDHPSVNAAECKFIAHAPSSTTQSDLIEMGFDPEVIDKLPDYRGTLISAVDGDSADRATRVVEVYEVFIKVDFDGDGVAELRRVILGGSHDILMNDEVAFNQIVTGSTWPLPHQWEGISLYDRVKEIEDASTTLMRQTIDNNENANLQRTIGDPRNVEMADLMTGRKRGFIRAKNPAEVIPFPVNSLDPSTPQLMDRLDRMRSDRAGSSMDVSPEAIPVANAAAHSVERVMSKMEAMTKLYVENFADTVILELYKHIHRLLRTHSEDEISMKVNNEYVMVDPRQWPERTKMTVEVGSGLGEQQRKGAAMLQVIANQEKLGMAGSSLVNDERMYAALKASSRYNGLNFPEAYYLDPQSEEGMQYRQQMEQQQQQEKQEAEQKEIMLAQFQKALVDIVEQTKQMKIRDESQHRMADRDLEIEKELNNMVHKATELELVHDADVPASAV